MRNIMVLLTVLLLSAAAGAQSPVALNTGALILQANELHNKGQYKKAIEIYRQVPRSDTNYVRALYEMALTYQADSNYAAAMKMLDEGAMIGTPKMESDFLTLRANVLDDMGTPESSLRLYDSALRVFPMSDQLRLNRSITLIRLNRHEEAARELKQQLISSPFYASAHIKLANCALAEGRIIPAMMAAFTYLVMAPEGRHHRTAVSILSEITNRSTSVDSLLEARKQEEPVFAREEKIILSKMAFAAGFKSLTSLDDKLLRQLQVLCEVLRYDPDSEDFYMQFYVPYLKKLISDRIFEPVVMEAFSALDIQPITQYMKKNQKAVSNATDNVVAYFNGIRFTRMLDPERRDTATSRYHYQNNALWAIGVVADKDVLVGDWVFYHPSGCVKSAGKFDKEGKKEGAWTFYRSNGTRSSIERYVNGVQEGEQEAFDQNGVLTESSNMKNGKSEGIYTLYYNNGNPKSVTPYKAGQEDGLYKSYYANGKLRQEVQMKADKMHGSFVEYHPNGKKKQEATYREGKLEGITRGYHDNGQLSSEITYVNGEAEGKGRDYHPNGKLRQERFFVAGRDQGEVREYDDQGTLVTVTPFEKGEINGTIHNFDHDGKEYASFEYSKGVIQSARYVNKEGKEIYSARRKGKKFQYSTFAPDGTKLADHEVDENGRNTGTWTLYYPNGKVRQYIPYVKGDINGVVIGFYPNGVREMSISYKDGEKDGPDSTWYGDGKLQLAGTNSGGDQSGVWTSFHPNGTISDRYTRVGGDYDGLYEDYGINGALESDIIYDKGWIKALAQYDSTGRRFHYQKLNNIQATYLGKYPNGQTSYEVPYVKGDFHGSYRAYYSNGKPASERNYDRGVLQGAYKRYHPSGKLESSGSYTDGELSGTWNYYDFFGTLYRTEQYQDGLLEGKTFIYHHNGKVKQEIEYHRGDNHGYQHRYNEKGQLVLSVLWEYGVVKGYTYLGKDGKPVPLIALPGGTGAVTGYYANGARSIEMHFLQSKSDGPFNMWYDDGKPYYKGTDRFGDNIGPSTEYYANGNTKYEYHFENDKLLGPAREYHENGKPKEVGSYIFGMPHGTVTTYGPDGNKTAEYQYYYGTLINTK